MVNGYRGDLTLLRERRFALLFAARTTSVLGGAFGPVALAFGVLGLPGATATAGTGAQPVTSIAASTV